jgi:hypothetical protein
VQAGLLALGVAAGCGSRDEPRGSSPEPEPEGSRIWEVLTDPESIDALCRLVGVSARGTAMLDCDETVEQCRDVASALETLGGFGSGVAAPDVDLEPLLGCPVSASQLDVCLAQALERGIELYGDAVTCAAMATPEVEIASLALVPGCIAVVLSCPDLLGGMF